MLKTRDRGPDIDARSLIGQASPTRSVLHEAVEVSYETGHECIMTKLNYCSNRRLSIDQLHGSGSTNRLMPRHDGGMEIYGTCKPGFETVQEAFEANFDEGLEVGAAGAARCPRLTSTIA